MNTRVAVKVINDDQEFEDWGVKDLRDPTTYTLFLLAFGNGLIEEMRVVAETKEGIFAFINLVERGGYRRSQAAVVKAAKLYKVGDACFPEINPFIFISPIADTGESVDFDNFRAELEHFLQSRESEDRLHE